MTSSLVALMRHKRLIVGGWTIKRLLLRIASLHSGLRGHWRGASLRLLVRQIALRCTTFLRSARGVRRLHQCCMRLRRLISLVAVPAASAIGVLGEALRHGRIAPEQLAARWAAVRGAAGGGRPLESVPDPRAALEAALESGSGPVIVAGSLYLVGAARAILVTDPLLVPDPPLPPHAPEAPR